MHFIWNLDNLLESKAVMFHKLLALGDTLLQFCNAMASLFVLKYGSSVGFIWTLWELEVCCLVDFIVEISYL